MRLNRYRIIFLIIMIFGNFTRVCHCSIARMSMLDQKNRTYIVNMIREGVHGVPLRSRFASIGWHLLQVGLTTSLTLLLQKYFIDRIAKPFLLKKAIKDAQEPLIIFIDDYLSSIVSDLDKFTNTVTETTQIKFTTLLLSGPPGLGKTNFVLQFSAKIQAKLYAVNTILDNIAANPPAIGSISANDVLKTIFDMVKEENKRYPNTKKIIFFDELDQFFKEGSPYYLSNFQTIIDTNTLEEVSAYNNIIVIAATNYPEKLSEAVRNRFRYKISIDYSGHLLQNLFLKIIQNQTLIELILQEIQATYENLVLNKQEMDEEKLEILRKQFIEVEQFLYPKLSIRTIKNSLQNIPEDIPDAQRAQFIAEYMFKEIKLAVDAIYAQKRH